MTETPVNDRVAKMRKKRRETGMKRLELWIYPEDENDIRSYWAWITTRTEDRRQTAADYKAERRLQQSTR